MLENNEKSKSEIDEAITQLRPDVLLRRSRRGTKIATRLRNRNWKFNIAGYGTTKFSLSTFRNISQSSSDSV